MVISKELEEQECSWRQIFSLSPNKMAVGQVLLVSQEGLIQKYFLGPAIFYKNYKEKVTSGSKYWRLDFKYEKKNFQIQINHFESILLQLILFQSLKLGL